MLRFSLIRIAIAALVLIVIVAIAWRVLRRRPARTADGPANTELAAELHRDVLALCELGPRTADAPEIVDVVARMFPRPVERYADNLIMEIPGATSEVVIIGAHYDSVDESPGADDNASGVAGLLALARRFAGAKPARTLRFIAFAREEPPYFQTRDMGSWQYAKRCRERNERVVAMLSLEMLGYFDDHPGSQQYPPPLAALYPDSGNFIGFAGNIASRNLIARCTRLYRESTSTVPAESAVLPEIIPQTGWSDQWSFWQFGYPALMVTDTALYRNPHYHTFSDTPETLDYGRMAAVVEGLAHVVAELTK